MSSDFKSLRLAIACPMANEKATASAFVRELLDVCAPLGDVRFVAVFDNTCVDGSMDILKGMARDDSRISVVFAPECTCPVDAYLRSYREALATGFEWVLEINAGYRHQPSDLPQYFPCMLQGYDCIFGSRFLPGGQMAAPSFRRQLFSKGGTYVANALLGTKLADMTSGYQMFKREMLERLLARGIQSRYHFFQTEMKAYCRKGRSIEVPIRYKTGAKGLKMKVLADAVYHLGRLVLLRATARL